MQAFVEARYEYHWMPLLGCLVGQLAHIGAAQSSDVVGAITGVSYQTPGDSRLPEQLLDGLAALGVAARITDLTDPNRLQRFLGRRRIRAELRANRPLTMHGVGVSPFGPTWGLIVGCDDERRAWRRDGPMTEQVSPWLAEAEFNREPRLALIAAQRTGKPDRERIERAASASFAQLVDQARRGLFGRIEMLDSAVEIEPQRHSHDAQALAGNWGELATFWREHPHLSHTPIAQQLAVTLSRYATLFPYPMGGQPNSPGVRSAAIHSLREAAEMLRAAH